jgi:RimJ/RimL family protein N-acetyltransferase
VELRTEHAERLIAPGATNVVRLPSGRAFDPRRSRWEGVLDAEELDYCRTHGIELAYDCAQIGWVAAACVDDAPLPSRDERVVDLAAYASPEADAMRMLRTLSAQIEMAAAVADAAAAAVAIDRIRDAARAQLAACRARHGVVMASRCHLVVQARLARVEAPRAAPAAVGDEFSFRPWARADAPRYRRMLDNPRLWHYLPESYPQPLTEATALALIELGSIDTRQQAFAIVRDGEPIGQCLLRLHDAFAGMRTAEVAYWLAEEHWGKGWMSRILPAFVTHCFERFEVEVLEAWIRDDHAASARVAERAGFRRDSFAFESELAAALAKPRAQRYVRCRGDGVAARKASVAAGAEVAGSR